MKTYKYKREIKQLIAAEYNQPTEDLVRLFAGQVYSGRLRQSVVEDFTEITKQAFREFVSERITSRLLSAQELETGEVETVEVVEGEETEAEDEPTEGEAENDIVTTQDELDGYYIVKAICREVVDAQRITIRDVRSYCGVLLDNNNRKPICRLRFNRAQRYLSLIDEEKNEEMVAIDSLDDIYKYADRLKATVSFYESQQ